MQEKDFANYTLVTWAVLLFVTMWGGISSYISRLKRDKSAVFSFIELIGEVVISAGLGITAFLAMQGLDYNLLLSVAASSLCSHYGTRAMFVFEQLGISFITQLVKSRFGVNIGTKKK